MNDLPNNIGVFNYEEVHESKRACREGTASCAGVCLLSPLRWPGCTTRRSKLDWGW